MRGGAPSLPRLLTCVAASSSSRRLSTEARVFVMETGNSTERTYGSRRKADKAFTFRALPSRPNPQSSLVVTEHEGGARLVTLCGGSRNTLDVPLIRALRATLERLERNPAVTIVILSGADRFFSAGIDAPSFARAGSSGDADGRAAALASLREHFSLTTLIATYTKPVVAAMGGLAAGAGWAVGASAEYSYATSSSVVVFPETRAGLVPSGGATYHLARLPRGVGTWAALTGAVLEGEMVYWSQAARLWGAPTGERGSLGRALLAEAGAVSCSGAAEETPLLDDPKYRRALDIRRSYRSDGVASLLSNELAEDASVDAAEEWSRLQRWHGYFSVGDKASAGIAKSSQDGWEDPGDLVSVSGRKRHEYERAGEGDDHPGSYERMPREAAAARRARMGATSAHAAAVFTDAVPLSPPPHIAMKMRVVAEAFSGAGAAGAQKPVTVAGAAVPAGASVEFDLLPSELAEAAGVQAAMQRARLRSTVTTPLPANWETALRDAGSGRDEHSSLCTVTSAIAAAAVRVRVQLPGSAPTQNPAHAFIPPPVLLESMVRLAVAAAWPAGALSSSDATAIISRFLRGGSAAESPGGEDGRELLVALLTASTARVTAALHGLPPWALLDERAVGELPEAPTESTPDAATPAAVLSSPALEGPSIGFTVPPIPRAVNMGDELLPLTPRLFTEPDLLWYDTRDEDLMWPFVQGQWLGDKDGAGDRDAEPIFPIGAWTAAAPRGSPSEKAAAVARADMLKLVTVALRDPSAYAAPAAAHAALNANDAAAVRARLLGEPGLRALARIRAKATKAAGPRGDLEAMGDVELRARGAIVWPQLIERVRVARVLVYTGIASAAGIELRAADAAALADLIPETATGRAALARGVQDGDASRVRLHRLWADMLAGACKGKGDLPRVQLSADDAQSLRDTAAAFAAWEGVWLGRATGGTWVETVRGHAQSGAPTYVLAETRDAETGLMRVALTRSAAGGAQAADGSGASGARRSDGASSQPTFQNVGAAKAAIAEAERAVFGRSNPLGRLRSDVDLADDDSDQELEEILAASDHESIGGPLPPAVEPLPVEPAASEMALKPDGWDYDAVLRALSDTTGRGAVDLFSLPVTAFTVAAGARVADYFVREADGRLPAAVPASTAEIIARLASVASRSAPEESAFARETISALNAAPAGAADTTLALITAAGASTLPSAMDMEFRALARLFGLAPHAESRGSSGGAAASLDSLFRTPLASRDELNAGAEGVRTAARAALRERAAAQSAWENAAEAYFAGGEGDGALGDLFRRRYVYYRSPLADLPFDADATNAAINDEIAARDAAGEEELISDARRALLHEGGPDGLDDESLSQEAMSLVGSVGAMRAFADKGAPLVKELVEKAAGAKAGEKSKGAASLRGVPAWLA